MTKKRKIGDLGEKIAKSFLIKKGYEFIEKNFTCNEGEIDLIFWKKKDQQYLFVEVKTRTKKFYGSAEDAFGYTKRKKFENAVDIYLSEKAKTDNFRIDLIAVYLDLITRKAKIKHYKAV